MAENEICCTELEEALSGEELREEIPGIIADERMEKFEHSEEYRLWEAEIHKKGQNCRQYMADFFMKALTKHLSDGVLELTIREVRNGEECRSAVRKHRKTAFVPELACSLPPFKVYIDIVPRVGVMELYRIRHHFEIEPEVEVKDTELELEDAELRSITFGSFSTKMKVFTVTKQGRMELCGIKGSVESPRTIEL